MPIRSKPNFRPLLRAPTTPKRTINSIRSFKPNRFGKRARTQVEPAAVFEDMLPDLTMANDDFGWACCPFHSDSRPSLCVNVHSGWYRCYSTACGAKGSSIVSFVGGLLGLDPSDARRHLETRYG